MDDSSIFKLFMVKAIINHTYVIGKDKAVYEQNNLKFTYTRCFRVVFFFNVLARNSAAADVSPQRESLRLKVQQKNIYI